MKNKNIAFLTFDWANGTNPVEPNGCAWYRCHLPGIELEKKDWLIGFSTPTFHSDHGFGAALNENESYYGWDIVVFKLIMLEQIANTLENFKNRKQKIVVDIDDFYEGLTSDNLAYENTDPEKYPENNRNHYFRIIESADAIITSTDFLYDFYTKEKGFTNVFLVKNGIDIDRWHKKQDYSRHDPTIGWVGAIPWRSKDLETLQPFFGQFLEKNHLGFHHSGHIKELDYDVTDLMNFSKNVRFSHQPRKTISQYPKMFKKIDIGIVPLSNIPFNHAKSTIKGLEYAAAGIPFVASYSPEYEKLAKEGVGRIAYNKEDWTRHLEELLDPKIRKEETEKNYETVKEKHSMTARARDWDVTMKHILDL
jgi:glycosyltransferase involved in cell wall biosynthesis